MSSGSLVLRGLALLLTAVLRGGIAVLGVQKDRGFACGRFVYHFGSHCDL